MSYRLLARGGMFLPLAAASLYAQFSQFTTTDDGKQVYFISPLTLHSNAGAPPANRLYRIGPEGVSLFAEAPPSFSFLLGSNSGIRGPQVSGDGSLIGFTIENFKSTCAPSTECSPVPAEAILRGAKTMDLGPGTLQLSRNGRWALITPTQFFDPSTGSPIANLSATLTDLTAGTSAAVPTAFPYAARFVASDGSVLLPNGIWKQGTLKPLPPPTVGSYNPLALSDDASTVIAASFIPGQQGSLSIVAIALATGKMTTIRAQTPTQAALFMGLSNKGRQVLYRFPGLAAADGPAFVADTSTGESTPIVLPPGETVFDGTLSGDGGVAILATNMGRILRVTLATGAIEPLIPPTPYFSNLSNVAIGSYTAIATTYTADWSGVLLLDGKPLPVLATKPGIEVDVQIPWEQSSGSFPFKINLQTGSPFEQVQQVFVSPIAPAFVPMPAGQTAIFPIEIIEGDWSGFQTTQPRAGDIVYMYMTGLGPVSGPVHTGVPAPLDLVEPLTSPLTCTFTPQVKPAQTLFAGLAPGLVGIYQVAFRIPDDPNTKPLNGLQCTLGSGASFGFGILAGTISLP